MIEIKPLDDVMNHFSWIFFAYISLFAVVCINFFKALYINKKVKDVTNNIRKAQVFDLVVDVVCGIAMASSLMFFGVLADNNALNYNIWLNRILVISFASLNIFILNIIVVLKNKKV